MPSRNEASECPARSDLLGAVLGTLSDAKAPSVFEHLGKCAQCSATVSALEHSQETDEIMLKLDALSEASVYAGELECQRAVDGAKRSFEGPSFGGRRERRTSDARFGQLRDYALIEQLGEGGMGTVYKALHTRFDKLVAVKVISNDRIASPRALERFDREIRAIGRLDHPNIVRALDAGEVDGVQFLSMELVDGTNLAELVRQRGPLPADEACAMIKHTATALQYIHDHGLVHRDIKPSNLMLAANPDHSGDASAATTRYGQIKILDLGLARLSKDHFPSSSCEDDPLTPHSHVMGTYDFLAPEQARRAHEVDGRADIYSLGCTLYYLLTAQTPFPNRSVPEKLLAHQTETPPKVRDLVNGVPEELEAIVARMMAPEPVDRYQTAAEVADALNTAPAVPPKTLAESTATATRSRNRRSGLRLFATIVTLATLIPLAFVFGPGLYRIVTNKGVLVIRTEAEEVKVVVKDQVGTIVDQQTAREITLKPGDYKIEVTIKDKLGEISFFTKRFALRRGDKEIVHAAIELAKSLDYSPGVSPGAAAATGKLPSEFDPGLIPESERFDWHPEQLVAVLGSHRGRHWDRVSRLAASPSRDLIATGSTDRVVRLWDSTLNLLETIRGHEQPIAGLAFSPDGLQLISTGQDGTMRGWNISPENRVEPAWTFDTDGVFSDISVSGDGSRVVGSNGRVVSVWLLTDAGPELVSFVSTPLALACACAAERTIVADREGSITIWNQNDPPNKLSELNGHTKRIHALAVSPDESRLASASHDGTVRIWDLKDPTAQPIVLHGREEMISVAFSHNGQRVAAGDWIGRVQVWDISSGSNERTFLSERTFSRISSLTFNWNDQGIFGGNYPFLTSWDLSQQPPELRVPAAEHFTAIASVDVVPDAGRLISTSTDGRIHTWQLSEGSPQLVASAIEPRGILLAASAAGRLAVVNRSSGREVRIWDLERNEVVAQKVISDRKGRLRTLSVSEQGDWLAAGFNNSVFVWRLDRNNSDPLAELQGHETAIRNLELSPDGSLLCSVSEDNIVRLWKRHEESFRELAVVAHSDSVFDVAFSPDSTMLACGEKRSIRVWSLANDKPELVDQFDVKSLDGRTTLGNRSNLAFAPNSRSLAFASSVGDVHVWELGSETLLRSFQLPGRVAKLRFLPDGRHLVTGNPNGTIYVLKM